MKKIIMLFFGFLAISFIYLIFPAEVAIAAQVEYCKPPEIIIAHPEVDGRNYWKYSGVKVRPNFVLDYYQDPDRNGVDITVVIESTELSATYVSVTFFL